MLFTPASFTTGESQFKIGDPFFQFKQHFNIAPTQDAPVIVPSEIGNVLKMLRWGLIPGWAKAAAVGHINARVETIAEKPTFKPLVGKHHCLEALKILEDAVRECKKRNIDTLEVREALDLLEPLSSSSWQIAGFRDTFVAAWLHPVGRTSRANNKSCVFIWAASIARVRSLLQVRIVR